MRNLEQLNNGPTEVRYRTRPQSLAVPSPSSLDQRLHYVEDAIDAIDEAIGDQEYGPGVPNLGAARLNLQQARIEIERAMGIGK